MNQAYLELVLNEFFAYYGSRMASGELYISEIDHKTFVFKRECYIILKTGIVKLPLGQSPFKTVAYYGRVEALMPTQILALAELPAISPNSTWQLQQFSKQVQERLYFLTREQVQQISQQLECLTTESEIESDIVYYAKMFWHAEFQPTPEQDPIL